ncbi:hypothetical protein ACET3Z_029270 [Daucus carota]
MNTNTIGDKRPLAKVYRRPDNKVIKATAGRNIKTLVGNKLVDEVEGDEHNCNNLVDEQDGDQDNDKQSDEDMQEGEEDSAQEDSAEDMEQDDSAQEGEEGDDDSAQEGEEGDEDSAEEEDDEQDDEAAFETHIPRKRIAGTLYPLLKFMNKDVKKTEGAKHINKKKDEVKIRISPRHFSKMVGELTKEQRDWVTRAGFALLLDFELDILPTKIAYNVLQIFDHHSISLKLKDGDINITSEDVYDVLGLPNGGHPIILASPGKYSQRIKDWHAQFTLSDQITTQMIVQVMKNQEVNDNFKLNFLLVMSNVLIGTKGASYVDKQLLQLDDNLDNLKKYNWADFLLGYLVIGMESWNRTTTTFFRGSLIFLTLLYVDRVRYKGMNLVDRQFPSYNGWTLEMLRQRQEIEVIDGAFGVGSIQPSLKEYLQKIDPSEPPKTKVNDNENGAWDTWQYWSEVDRIEKDYLKRKESTSQQHHESTQCQSPQNTQYYTPPTEAADGNVEQTEEDVLHDLRKRAEELVDIKSKFDEDLVKAREKFPDNKNFAIIGEMLKEYLIPNQETGDDLGDELSPEIVASLEVVEQMDRTDIEILAEQQKDDERYVPSFSLGLDDIEKESNQNLVTPEPEPQEREKSKRTKKVGPYQKSPYVNRVIDIKERMNNEDFGYWVFLLKKKGELLDDLFRWEEVRCIKEHLLTLKPKTSVYYSVIDTWATILNDSEKYKADGSPLRLFCTIGDLIFSIDPEKKVTETYDSFASGMDKILQTFSIKKVEDVEMVCFPINKYEHYYLVCYGIKTMGYFIIDNIKREAQPKMYYSRVLEVLHSHFCNYISRNENPNLGSRVRKMKPRFVKMPWQTTDNSTDCGIFLMRHMETFKGDVKNWNTDLTEEGPTQDKQITRLRFKYNTAILSSHLNELKEPITTEAVGLYNTAEKHNIINVVLAGKVAEKFPAKKSGKRVKFAVNLISSFHEVERSSQEGPTPS